MAAAFTDAGSGGSRVPAVPAGLDGAEAWWTVGRIGRPHGIRGGFHVHLDNPDSELLRAGLPVRLLFPDGRAQEREVEALYGPGLLRLLGVGDRDAVTGLRGASLQVRRADFPPPADDEAYLVDLIGARVVRPDGQILGTLESFDTGGPQILAAVRLTDPARPAAVDMPFVPGFVVAVDEAEGLVVVDAPAGLFEGEPDEA